MSVTIECELEPIFPDLCFCLFRNISGRVILIDDVIVNVNVVVNGVGLLNFIVMQREPIWSCKQILSLLWLLLRKMLGILTDSADTGVKFYNEIELIWKTVNYRKYGCIRGKFHLDPNGIDINVVKVSSINCS